MFDYEDQRASFRYVFKKGSCLPMAFRGKTVRVLDISAGGMAFENQGFSKYDADTVQLNLDMPNFAGDPILKAEVRILNLTENNICHSIFENCSVEDYELVHKFVLEMQKKDLTRNRLP